MSTIDHVVIVGAGLAGANAAFALRDEGFTGRITLFGNENEWPYERPPLSKNYLRAEDPIEKAYVRQPADYTANDIDLRRGTGVATIDPERRDVTTTDGITDYDALILATGATPRRLMVE